MTPSNILCIIPARGGSKRLPGKNLLPLAGKPLIAHSIEQAKAAKRVSRVIVSTDDPEIEKTAKDYGAEVIRRPPGISDDHATSESAIRHVLDEVEKKMPLPDLILFLQCTSPIREPHDIDRAIETLIREEADSLLSVTRNERYLWHQVEGRWTSLNYNFKKRWRDQDFPVQVRENGSLYVFKPEILKRENNRLGGKIAVYEMDYWSSFQIDTPEQGELCQWILEKGKGRSHLQSLPLQPALLVSDFDGVMTDNRVGVTQEGNEFVLCNRVDGWGLTLLKQQNFPVVVLSTEKNPVVAARCKKLGLECYQGFQNKLGILKEILAQRQISAKDVIYIGNDTNDLECLQHVGCGVAVADSHPQVIQQAQIILSSKGGEGAVREICELILAKLNGKKN